MGNRRRSCHCEACAMQLTHDSPPPRRRRPPPPPPPHLRAVRGVGLRDAVAQLRCWRTSAARWVVSVVCPDTQCAPMPVCPTHHTRNERSACQVRLRHGLAALTRRSHGEHTPCTHGGHRCGQPQHSPTIVWLTAPRHCARPCKLAVRAGKPCARAVCRHRLTTNTRAPCAAPPAPHPTPITPAAVAAAHTNHEACTSPHNQPHTPTPTRPTARGESPFARCAVASAHAVRVGHTHTC